MEIFENLLASENYVVLAIIFSLMAFLWFLPALLALFFNRKHFKLILIACIPAGFSFVAWFGVMAWALTGKAVAKYAGKYAEKARSDEKS